jgi:hypothetical protein
MKLPIINRRRFVGGSVLALGTTGLSACGGGGAAADSADIAVADPTVNALGASSGSTKGGTPTPAPAPGTDRSARSNPTPVLVGAVFTALRVTAAQQGAFGYSATVLPLQGQVPAGHTILSPDDASLRGSILSRWDDGSAAVVVVGGTAAITGPADLSVRLQAGKAPSTDVDLTANRVAQVVSSVRVDLGALGTINVTDFSRPERIWWANPQTICARYRAAAPAHATLEAVIDIHGFTGGRALVEVVLENSRMVTATPAKPGNASYSAVVTINGTSVTTVQSSQGPEGAHTAFRAWYAALWIGGDVGLRATQVHTDLQRHPLFFKIDRAGGDMSLYANDTYTPWTAGRHRASNMGGGGDHPSIGPIPRWEAHFLQTGDARAARAVEASALAILGYNVNYRDATTGLVPDASRLAGKYQSGYGRNWPTTFNNTDTMTWELAHSPAAGLMAFVTRPSPVFIEIAQKIAVWNGTWNCDPVVLTWGWNGAAAGVTDGTGLFGTAAQLRGRAWGVRSLTHATFLSPDGSEWRAGGALWLDKNRRYLDAWRTGGKATLNAMWDGAPNAPEDVDSGMSGFQISIWMYHYLVGELHRAANAKLLTGAAQSSLSALADWCALQPVRWVNEQPNGGWRFVPYRTRLGDGAGQIDAHATWTAQRAFDHGGAPATVAGPFGVELGSEATWAAVEARGIDGGGTTYAGSFVAALACAVERGVTNASSAWTTVTAGITNWNAWRGAYAADPRYGAFPRTFAAPDVTGNVWNPTKGPDGNILDGSWANLPPNEWCVVAGTSLSQLRNQLLQAGFDPSLRQMQRGNDSSIAITFKAWCGMAWDMDRGRGYNLAGGGHADSSMNGVWRLDIERMGSGSGWVVDAQPSKPTAPGFEWNEKYSNFTYYPFTPPNADEAAYGAWDFLPDGTITSRHTYGDTVFDTVRARVVNVRASRWDYDTSSKAMRRQRWRDTTSGMEKMTYTGGSAFYHAGTDRIYGRLPLSNDGNGAYGAWGYVQGDGRDRVAMSLPTPCYFKQSLCALDADTLLLLSNGDRYNPVATWAKLNMRTGAWIGSGVVSGGLIPDDEMPAVVYIPEWRKCLRYVQQAGTGVWRLLDPITMTETAYTPAGAPPPWVFAPGTKIAYYPRRSVVISVLPNTDAEDCIRVMRVA